MISCRHAMLCLNVARSAKQCSVMSSASVVYPTQLRFLCTLFIKPIHIPKDRMQVGHLWGVYSNEWASR